MVAPPPGPVLSGSSGFRVSRLELENFRGFETLDLYLSDTTVLVGINGSGKSTILDAIATMLTWLIEGVKCRADGRDWAAGDIRVGTKRTKVSLTVQHGENESSWTIPAAVRGLDGEPKSVDALKLLIDSARESIESDSPLLPLAVYYPTNRSALDIPERIRTAPTSDTLSAYDGALEGGASDFRGFFAWFREAEDILNQHLARGEKEEAASSPVHCVRQAIEKFYPGVTDLRVERGPVRMTLLHRGTRLDVAQLSDGEKCLLALIGDLARRMVLASPAGRDPLHTPAVVMIDEVELHLHPGLQRTVLPSLQNVFPAAQLIVTTHSPQVLSSVRAESIRLLKDFKVQPCSAGTWQRDTNRILEMAFADPGRPPEVAEKIRLLRDAVDEGEVHIATELIKELRGLVEGQDPDVTFLEHLLPPSAETTES